MISTVFWEGNSICKKFACLSYHSCQSFYMADGGKSCFRSSERKVGSTPPLQADFTQQLSPRLSYGPPRKTNLCQPLLQQEVSHRFKTHCVLLAVWHWDTFQAKQFETQSPLWQRLNQSFGGLVSFIILLYGIPSLYNYPLFAMHPLKLWSEEKVCAPTYWL